jgi:dTDP-4-dehydrorhamnose reductase
MKILLTGANGQLGRELHERFLLFQGRMLEKGRAKPELAVFSKAELDITQWEQLAAIVAAHRPQVIINAAAYTAVDKAEQEPDRAFSVNRDGVKNLALVCKAHNLPLIHVSTDYVFSGSKTAAYDEQDHCSPLNVYGASKAAGEVVLQETWEKHLILRVSWVFGRYGHNFVKTMIRLATTQKELRIVADQRGCPTPASALADLLLLLAEQALQQQPQWGIFHYSGDQAVSWFEFAQTIVKHGKNFLPLQCEKIHPITTADFPTPAKRPQHSVMNIEKIRKFYGVSPAVWEEALVSLLRMIGNRDEQFSP